MKYSVRIVVGICSLVAFANTHAEELSVKQDASKTQLTPQHTGKTMAQIEAALGNPQQKLAPVGEPPISRWQYSNQTVYFEENRVIHSVSHTQH